VTLEAHQLEDVVYPFDTVCATNAVADVLGDRDVGEEGVLLEHHADVASLRGNVLAVTDDDRAMDRHFSRVGGLEPCNDSQRSGLSTAGRTDERHEGPLGDVESFSTEIRGSFMCRERPLA